MSGVESRALERQRLRAEDLRASKSFERRGFGGECEIREADDADDGLIRFSGFASLFNTPYDVEGFRETILPGAFARTLGESPDVVFRIEHKGLPLARTKRPDSSAPGALTLTEQRDRGLKVDATFDALDTDAQQLRLKMRNGLLSEMSFAFRTTDDEWSSSWDDRKIKAVTLNGGDVAAVVFGASPATGATTSIRSAEQYESEIRGKYAAHELAELGGKGEAFSNPDGHWSFPTHDRDDWEKARDAVGRGGPDHDKIRLYLMARAKALGLTHLIPSTWRADGSLLGTLTPKRSGGWVDLAAAALDLNALRQRPVSRAVENDDADLETCPQCDGSGKILEGNRTCPECEGSGKVEAGTRGALRPHELRALEREARADAARARRRAVALRRRRIGV